MRVGGEEARKVCMTAGRESKSHGTTGIEGKSDNTLESGHLRRMSTNPSLDMWTFTHDEKRSTLEQISEVSSSVEGRQVVETRKIEGTDRVITEGSRGG
jgi:hypothetical protein